MARLLLIRHAEAVESDGGPGPEDDRNRPLSGKGRKQVQQLARKLLRKGLPESVLLTSPWTRALETATLLRRALGWRRAPRPVAELAGDARIDDALGSLVAELAAAEWVVAVGHEPCLSGLVSLLASGPERSLKLRLRKAGWCLLEVDPAGAVGTARILELRNPSPFRNQAIPGDRRVPVPPAASTAVKSRDHAGKPQVSVPKARKTIAGSGRPETRPRSATGRTE